MASFKQTLYIGITSNLNKRVYQHKTKCVPNSFTARYNVDKLVYFEIYENVQDALAREKQLKSWRREKKINLIMAQNPNWNDLSLDWNT